MANSKSATSGTKDNMKTVAKVAGGNPNSGRKK